MSCHTAHACSNALLLCPNDQDCTVRCTNIYACTSVEIAGPQMHDFTLICHGEAACENAIVHAERSLEVSYHCQGVEACSGPNTVLNCGVGQCEMLFVGEVAGFLAQINTNQAEGFACAGRYASCPPDYQPPTPCPEIACGGVQTQNPETCGCECANNPDEVCPGPGRTDFDAATCQCVCPAGTPTEAYCESMGMVWRDCACECPNECPAGQIQNVFCECEAKHCCLTLKLDYTPWAGICWKETTEAGCDADPYRRCVWDERFCLPSPPFNSLDNTRACKFVDEPCSQHADCCSEFCVINTTGAGLCM